MTQADIDAMTDDEIVAALFDSPEAARRFSDEVTTFHVAEVAAELADQYRRGIRRLVPTHKRGGH